MIIVALTMLLTSSAAPTPTYDVSGQSFARNGCRLEFQGEVRLVRQGQTISSDRLEVISTPREDGSCGAADTAVATGNVQILDDDGRRLAGPDRAVIALRTGAMTATGATMTGEAAKPR